MRSRIPDVEKAAQGRKPWDLRALEDDYGEDEVEDYIQIFSKSNRPADLQRQFDLCEPPPDFTILQPFAKDPRTGKSVDLDAK